MMIIIYRMRIITKEMGTKLKCATMNHFGPLHINVSRFKTVPTFDRSPLNRFAKQNPSPLSHSLSLTHSGDAITRLIQGFLVSRINMLCQVECSYPVVVPAKNLEKDGFVPRSLIVNCLLKQLKKCKATVELGYFLSITKLKSIGDGTLNGSSSFVLFPVAVKVRTFLPKNGETMVGIVCGVHRLGVFLRCGPMNYVYLSARKMPNYEFVEGQNRIFVGENRSRIENGVVVQFVVFAVRWMEKNREIEREFMILASLEGNGLGPVSSPGADELDF